MYDTILFLVLSVLFSSTVSNLFLDFLDEQYGVNTFIWYFITYISIMLPVSIFKYNSSSSKCKKRDSFNNMIQALKDTAVTVGIVDILSLVIIFIPVIGSMVDVIEYVPLIGTSIVWLGCFFLYHYSTKFFTLFIKNKYCGNIDTATSLIFSFVSILKPFISNFLSL